MNVLDFNVISYQYPDLYKDVLSIDWDEFENIINLLFRDSNVNYKTLVDIFNNKTKQSIIINVTTSMHNSIIRYYNLELLPNTLKPSMVFNNLYSQIEHGASLKVSFKILKSELTFNE